MGESRGPLPAGTIIDSPDFAVRGVMLNIARDRIPTMDTLYCLVDELAAMKVNHLELSWSTPSYTGTTARCGRRPVP